MKDVSVIRIVGTNCGDPAKEDEFNDWYTNDHILFVMRSPYVLSAERYQRMGESKKYPKYLAVYGISDEKALEGHIRSSIPEEALQDRYKRWPEEGIFTRKWLVNYKRIARWGDMESCSARCICGTNCGDPAKENEFNDWYTNHHVPFVMRAPLVIAAERYQRIGDDQEYPKYLAIYGFENEQTLDDCVKNSVYQEGVRDRRERWPDEEGVFSRQWLVNYKRIARRQK